MTTFSLALLLLGSNAIGGAFAHIALWHKSMYGLNGTNGQTPYNTAEPARPLDNATFAQWWFHGFLNQPPAPGDFLDLPAGGNVTVEVASNKAFTTLGQQQPTTQCPLGPGFCHDWTVENNATYWDTMHTTGHSDVKGCAIAIAYNFDPNQIKPEDFTVISVQRDCVWKREVNFSFPSQLQACPSGGCNCLWSWIHDWRGGTTQTTHSFFKCRVTNPAAPGRKLGKAVPAQDCAGDKAKCARGAKQPMYWKFFERNNVFYSAVNPPVYLASFGFSQGAQNDAFDDGWVPGNSTTSTNTSTTSISSVTKTASTTMSALSASSTVAATGIRRRYAPILQKQA